MRHGITCFVAAAVVNATFYYFCLGTVLRFSLEWKEWYQIYHYSTNGCGKTISYNGIKSESLKKNLMSETCLRISDSDFYWVVTLSECVMLFFNQGFCISVQNNLIEGCSERILIQTWAQVMDSSLPGLTWYIRLRVGTSHLSIPGIVVCDMCYISHCF